MKTRDLNRRSAPRMPWAAAAVLIAVAGLLAAAPAGATDLIVRDGQTGAEISGSYRWLVQKDLTYHVPMDSAGQPMPDSYTVAVGFHRSYMPVVVKGANGGGRATLPALNPAANLANNPADAYGEYFYVSVLPDSGYSIGGAAFHYQDAFATVYVNPNPIPTAQIVVQVCQDNYPINGVCDPTELGLEDFEIILEDGGGRYGMAAGVQTTDAFGWPLGTTYDASGNVVTMGSGYHTDADGYAYMKNLPPGKFGIQAVPRAGEGWVQTSTIEGTKINDAWVKANEPAYFAEFGPPGPHVFQAFVKPFNNLSGGGTDVSGQVVNLHMSRPPDYAMYAGAPFPHTNCWVGLNEGALGTGPGLYAAPCTEDGNFTIPGVPNGAYQLVAWDDNLDLILLAKQLTVGSTGCNGNTGCNLGFVPAFQWFARQEHWVFNDDGGGGDPMVAADYANDGMRRCETETCDNWSAGDEVGIPEQAVNLRWRDGTMNQSAATDLIGFVPFDETFPFFSWQVAEVDYARFKATGVTVYVDDGGPIDQNNTFSWGGNLNPQPQGNPADPDMAVTNANFRVEQGPVLVEGFQNFIGQTSVFEWGKQAFAPDENGGISGIVFYSVTRAEDDPKSGGAEPWEPGIPGVKVNLYATRPPNNNGNCNAGNDVIGTNPDGSIICGFLINAVTTDSWDVTPPSNCQYGSSEAFVFDPDGPNGDIPSRIPDCFDNIRNFNQVRPAVFDGGWAFFDCYQRNNNNRGCEPLNSNHINQTLAPLPANRYVVEVIPPAGYEIVRSQDKNVDFGDERVISGQLLPAECVGALYTVPAFLSLNDRPTVPVDAKVPANLAGQVLNTCNKKLINLNDGANAAADFFLFTEVPIAAQAWGMILDDTQNEFDPNSPQFGEKYAPPFVPVGIRDWTGREIGRTLSDGYGRYNYLTPSTWSANLPQPSGMSPNMITACMNAKMMPVVNSAGEITYVADPQHNPQYSQFCYTLQYMPGATVYLDTPVVPVAAFTGADTFPLDCEYGNGTPRIYSVDNGQSQGPYLVAGGAPLTITSVGNVAVPNPSYEGLGGTTPKTIIRDFGFGCSYGNPSVTIGGVAVTEVSCGVDGAGREVLSVFTDASTTTGQLVVTRADGGTTNNSVTVQVGAPAPVVVAAGTQYGIQNAIDTAPAGSVISVAPGVHQEMVIMWKPVKLQGWGEGSIIDAVKAPPEALQIWRNKVQNLLDDGSYSLVPGQEAGAFVGVEPLLLFNEEGAGVLVLGLEGVSYLGSRIDGLTITGSDTGGGIIVNGFAPDLEISNNWINNNSGFFGGGIRIGHPTLVALDGTTGNQYYPSAGNGGISIHNNYVGLNGGLNGAGAGVTLGPGSDNYSLTDNYICGNFNSQDGGGVAHFGLSDGGLIAGNKILFNQSFLQQLPVSGAGLLISGQPPLLGQTLSQGTGDVTVDANLILGNSAEAGDGGGIRLTSSNEYKVDITNNMIANNVAALAGGGISIGDAANVTIAHNTIVNNDSTATSGSAFTGLPDLSEAQPGAGIASHQHSNAFQATLPGGSPIFSNPSMEGNIIWHNRQFVFAGAATTTTPGGGGVTFGLCPTADPTLQAEQCGALGYTQGEWVYDNLGVVGSVGVLTCTDCFTDDIGVPGFVAEYVNGNRNPALDQPEQQTMFTAAAFDEGGNFIRLRFGPLTLWNTTTLDLFGDYHLSGGLAETTGATHGGFLAFDFDGDARPTAVADIGADEVTTAALKTPSDRGRALDTAATASNE